MQKAVLLELCAELALALQHGCNKMIAVLTMEECVALLLKACNTELLSVGEQ